MNSYIVCKRVPLTGFPEDEGRTQLVEAEGDFVVLTAEKEASMQAEIDRLRAEVERMTEVDVSYGRAKEWAELNAELAEARAEVERLTEIEALYIEKAARWGCCLDECPARADADRLAVIVGWFDEPGKWNLTSERIAEMREALRQHEAPDRLKREEK